LSVEVHAGRAVAANHPEVCHLALRTEFSAVYPAAAPQPVEVHAARAVAANHPEVCHLARRTESSAVYPDAAPQPVEGPLRIPVYLEVWSLSSVREINIS
jgi:DNA-binding IclR family transcriptional regulator